MRVILYEFLNNITQKVIGPSIRRVGQRLYEAGNQL